MTTLREIKPEDRSESVICNICDLQINDDAHSDESGDYHQSCYDKWMKREALAAGIPESVVDGKTKLSDHFSESYINWKCGRG